MAAMKVLFFLAVLSGVEGAASPCGTVAPAAPAPAPPPAENPCTTAGPVTTVTTTPAATVTTTPGTTVTTTPATTVTTTPAPATCCSITCDAGSTRKFEKAMKGPKASASPCGTVAPASCTSNIVCPAGGCSQKQCCDIQTTVTTTPATTVTTTPATTVTTTPATTVTTTPVPKDCCSFTCPSGSTGKKAPPAKSSKDASPCGTVPPSCLPCRFGKCNKQQCCDVVTTVTTTPGTTVTTTPATTVTTTPATTVTTTPAPDTCCSITCDAGSTRKFEKAMKGSKASASPCGTVAPASCTSKIVCPAGGCSQNQCCDIQTTVTTTPATTVTTTPTPDTCCSFTCSKGSVAIPAPPAKGSKASASPCGTVAPVCNSKPCVLGKCSQKQCCFVPTTVTTTPATTVTTTPATTVTTTPSTTVTTTPVPPSCCSFKCPAGSSFKAAPAAKAAKSASPCGTAAPAVCNPAPCKLGKCDKQQCCNVVTTVVVTTVTTTPPPAQTTVTTTPPPAQCSSFKCAAGATPKNPALVCANNKCSEKQCCQESPCGTVAPAARLYESKPQVLAQEAAKKEASGMPSWAFPFFAIVGMFTFAAGFAARRRNNRSSRQFQIVEPTDLELSDGEELLLE